MKNEIEYINTDLDLWAPIDLAPLADVLTQNDRLVPLYVGSLQDGTWSARFETGEPFLDPDQNIAAMLTIVDRLNEPVRSLWDACTLREFNIGYDCGDEPWGFNQKLTAATISRISAAGAGVVITIYPMRETDYSEAAIEILKNDESIQRYLGKEIMAWSTSTQEGSRFKVTQAVVKVTMTDPVRKRMVYVHCRMELMDQEQWVLKEIIKKEER